MKGFSVGLHQHGNRSHSPCTDHNQSDKSNFEIIITDLKTTVLDVAVTCFGIIYLVLFYSFIL